MSTNEKGPPAEPATRPAKAKVCHSAVWPVVVEEYGRSVTTSMMVVVMMMKSMAVVMMESMAVMTDAVMVPVSAMASSAGPPTSTPPLHNELRLTSQYTHRVWLRETTRDICYVCHPVRQPRPTRDARDCHVRTKALPGYNQNGCRVIADANQQREMIQSKAYSYPFLLYTV